LVSGATPSSTVSAMSPIGHQKTRPPGLGGEEFPY